jgi:hypothetical protein
MAYIGVKPTLGNFQICDAISVVNGQAAYTMQVGGVNVTPQSANHMIVSLNGTIQKPGSSFTVSGSTITFASNLATGDVIDFIQILGDVLDLGVPSDATVTAAKLNNDIISGQTALASEPADTDEFLVSDAGTLKRIDYSLIKGGGITEADQWRITTNVNSNSNADLSSNWERADVSGATYIGTGLSQSSGIFTFPSTGKYFITFTMNLNVPASEANAEILLKTTTDNSTYTTVAMASCGNNGSDEVKQQINGHFIFDVTNTSNDKFKLATDSFGSGGTVVRGSTNDNRSSVVVIRLGDT